MKNKVTLVNNIEAWSSIKRYKVNQLVSHNSSDWQNSTGKNSEPGVGGDWVKLSSTPNLQQVTDEGATTTNPIFIPELNLYSSEDDDYYKIIVEESGVYLRDLTDDYFLRAESGALTIRDIFLNATLSLKCNLLTATRTATFPDKSGTIAFLDDIPSGGATVLASNDFTDDTSAGIGGVAVGGLYHTSGVVKIRLI